ncbi:hypothetical protein R3P38DRAFT_3224662 [Favolaschia claudopus]|uniref:Uncharacterized protein n=1 Tax=Favolaschia claudopus TaxID=2862362 RepID=A0AAV9ZWS3_9AGAR
MLAGTLHFGRLYRYADFSHLGSGEWVVRIGIDVDEDGPYQISTNGPGSVELAHILHSVAFYAALAYAYAKAQMELLVDQRLVSSPFPNSVFTTAVLSFCDAPAAPAINNEAALDTMEAITFLGSYNDAGGGHLVIRDDRVLLRLPVGQTVLLPSGAKRFKFTGIQRNERRYMFRQFVSAKVLEWVDKGKRVGGKDSLNFFSKLSDVYTA